MMLKKLALFVLFAIFPLRIPSVYGFNLQAVQHLVVFGDSLSDTGNSFAATGRPQAPYYYGRWTNGPNWVDYFSYFSWLNHHFLPATAFLQNHGSNFAVAGSNSTLLAGQIASYLGSTGGRAFSNDLYLIWIGSNDFSQSLEPQTTVGDIEAGIVSLWEAGARQFILMNLPDISLTPDVKAEGGAAVEAKQYVYAVNAALQAQIPYYALFLNITVDLIDLNTPFTQLVYTGVWNVGGVTVTFSDSSGAAFNPKTGTVAQHPNRYVFWDGFHPTARVHYYAAWLIFQTAFPGILPAG